MDLEQLSLEQLAGQLLWCGWGLEPEADPKTINEHARWLLEDLQAGGIVVFDRNLGSPAEIAALVTEIRRRSPQPPFIGIDQEGGRVCRLPLPGLTFPGNMALGLLDETDTTRRVHRAIGEQLAALGIDVDFAPSLDVNNNPHNPIIGVRAFGEDPDTVARHGLAALAGFRDAGVLPVIKHFPGHGDTSQDSHLELPTQPADRARLDAVELPPFIAALRAGAPAVMTTHIRFPQLDPQLPSTLSPRILTGLLREELGFDGFIVTDCLEMHGIAHHWGPEEAAVLALQAGADMLLVCHTQDTQARMHRAVCEAVRAGRLSEARLRQSVARVARAKELTAAVREAEPQPDRVSTDIYRQLETDVTERTLALVGDTHLTRPLDPALPIVVSGAAQPAADLATILRAQGYDATLVPAAEATNRTEPQAIWIALPQEPFTGGQPPANVLEWLQTRSLSVVVAGREPYCLGYYPETLPRLAAWGVRRFQLEAVTRWLSGARTRPLLRWRLP